MGDHKRGFRAAAAGIALALGLVVLSAPASLARQGQASIPAPESPVNITLNPRVLAIAKELRCPICQGLSVADSPTELAAQMRSLISDKVAQGESPEAIKAYFASKYGDWILLKPKREGFTWLVWLLPVAGLLIGAGAIVLFTRRSIKLQGDEAEGEEAAPESAEEAEYSRRLAREMEEMDK